MKQWVLVVETGFINLVLLYLKKLLKINQYKNFTSNFSLVILILSIYIMINELKYYNYSILGYIIKLNHLHIDLGYDGISILFIILTLYLGIISIISNYTNIISSRGIPIYIILIYSLVILITLNFLCLDLISFYILFELSLIPLFLLIGIFGGQSKNKASFYVLLYTLCSSLFLLLSILIIYTVYHSVDYTLISTKVISLELQSLLFIGFIIGLGVKTPIIPFHTWLPIVHSESILGGSILLAGIVLKLAIYGIIRLILSNISEISILYLPMLFTISIITIIYSSLVTLSQTDLKVIIAYSSISHLGVCIIGIFSNNLFGIIGSLLLSIAHGLVSPALFILIGGILYDRYHNRIILYYQGLTQFMPYFSLYLVLFSFSNIGTPISFNFIGELLVILGSIINNVYLGIFIASSILLSACYQMKLTNKLTGGITVLNIVNDLLYKEHFILLLLFIPVLIFGLQPNYLINIIYISSYSLIYSIII